MEFAIEFEILRGIENRVTKRSTPIPLARRPLQIATIVNEAKLLETGMALINRETVWLEDAGHDWAWANGELRYFSRVSELADVLVIFEKREGFLFCPECGQKTSGAPCAKKH